MNSSWTYPFPIYPLLINLFLFMLGHIRGMNVTIFRDLYNHTRYTHPLRDLSPAYSLDSLIYSDTTLH